MMWKRLSVFLTISVLVLSQLAAWPTWLTGEPQNETELKTELALKSEQILSQKQYITELEMLLQAQSEDSTLLVTKLSNSRTTIKALSNSLNDSKSELNELKALWKISSVDSKEKQIDLSIVTKALVDNNNVWGGIVGGGTTWNPSSGDVGVTAEAGVTYNKWGFLFGTEWNPSSWKIEIPKLEDLKFSTGIQWQF